LNGLGEHPFLFTNGGPSEGQDVGVVNHPIADGVGHRRVGELLVPDLRGDLGGDHRRRLAIA
jgi:hypothetical protein